MMNRYGNVVAIVVLAVASFWREYTLAAVARYAALGYILFPLLLRARAGYRRRLPYWTPQSWRRYFTVCGLFASALLICLAMAAAVEFRLPITGAGRSAARAVWVGVMIAFMLVGAWGLASAVFWLSEGDPSTQFTRFRRQQS